MAIKEHDLVTNIGPVVLEAQGDEYVDQCRIHAVVWVGATAAGNVVRVRHREQHNILWEGQADSTNTYFGIAFQQPGHHCPYGFYLDVVDNGKVLVYLAED